MLGLAVDVVAVLLAAYEDHWECKKGDSERENGVEEEVHGSSVRGKSIGEESVEGSAEAVEACGEREC
jgi:hypothetical protein